MKYTALALVALSGCYPAGFDPDDWRLAPGVSHLVGAVTTESAATLPGGVTLWWEDFDDVCLQRHEDTHKRQARRLNIAATAVGWITGELEAVAQAAQDCCLFNEAAMAGGGCWGDVEQDDAMAWAAYSQSGS